LAELGHGLAGQYFNLEPNLKFPLVRPNLAHLRPGITIDHRAKIKALARRGKRFVRKTNRSGGFAAGAIIKFDCRSYCLTNAGANRPAVILNAYLAAGKKVGYRRDRFFCVLRAGTYRQDQVPEGKFWKRLQDQSIFPH
jgi:hypothetical protein